MDSREVTPELTKALIHLAGEVRSFKRAEVSTERVLGQKISRSTIRRLAKQVGQELGDGNAEPESNEKQVVVPEAAVVSCDGGRLRTREPGQGRGVVLSGENGWRETKNASFERMTLNPDHSAGKDPCPELPTTFRTAEKVANIAEKALPQIEEPVLDETPERVLYEGPKRVLRTVTSSMAPSAEFGPLMQQEAQRRRFYEAALRAFLGDGLNWNWSIWKKHFPTFIPILDFIHAIQYVYCAAMALGLDATQAWETYVQYITWCWQGKVDDVIRELVDACQARGISLDERPKDDAPHKPLTDAIRYLRNNRSRMDYPRYRKLGLPVTSAPMESLIKQVNLRVKGTEMFWDDPDGAEAILQIRAAAISEDDRLDNYLSKRPGCPYTRRSTHATTAA